jgi:uncharacterized protein
MRLIEKQEPGAFCWIELGTTDQSAAKGFYTSLFGWSVNDFPMGPDSFYSMFVLDGRNAAAAYTLQKEQQSQGVPPHWMTYIAVDSGDDTAARVEGLGGKLLAAPFDVFDAGRMAVIQDPTGAVFSIWQAKKHSGIGIADADGTLCWADLSTPDPERAGKFYSELFGWQLVAGPQNADYLHIKNGQDLIGGIPPTAHRNPDVPPHWLPYFATSNCDGTAAKAKEQGAKFLLPPTTMENVGRMAVVSDPQGAVFALFQHMPRA